jgi:hypothetical protein
MSTNPTPTAGTTATGPHRSGWHPVNIGHLVMGVAFVGLVAVWALIVGDVVADHDVRWLLPVPWVLAGLAGLVAAALTGSRRRTASVTGWVGDDRSPAAADATDDSTDDSSDDSAADEARGADRADTRTIPEEDR